MAASEGVKRPGNTGLDEILIVGQLHCWASVWTSALAHGYTKPGKLPSPERGLNIAHLTALNMAVCEGWSAPYLTQADCVRRQLQGRAGWGLPLSSCVLQDVGAHAPLLLLVGDWHIKRQQGPDRLVVRVYHIQTGAVLDGSDYHLVHWQLQHQHKA